MLQPIKQKLTLGNAMKRIIFIILLLVTTSLFAKEMQHKVIVSYWSDGTHYRNYSIPGSINDQGKIQINRDLSGKINNINVLAYAFLQVDKQGNVYFQHPDVDLSKKDINGFCKTNFLSCQNSNKSNLLGNFNAFSKLNNNNHDLKKIISIGGAGRDITLNNALDHPENFINSIDVILKHYHLNGVDLDFEPSNVFTKDQANKYSFLVKNLRNKLGKNDYISIEVPGDNETLNSIGKENLDIISQNSYISLMGYEFHSAFYAPYVTGNNANLYSDPNEPNIKSFYHISDDQSIKHLTYLGVSSDKIILGFPAYFHAYGGVENKNNGLYQKFHPSLTPLFEGRKSVGADRLLQHILDKGFRAHEILMNHDVSAVYAYNPKTKIWLSYDDINSVAEKSAYVKTKNLAGMMMWNIKQDYPANDKNSLLHVVNTCLDERD